MSRYILVPATGADSDAPVFATALAVARLLPAHLEFLHVRADVQETLTAMASADMGGGMGYGQLPESLEREVASRQKKAELAFRDFCEQERLTRIRGSSRCCSPVATRRSSRVSGSRPAQAWACSM